MKYFLSLLFGTSFLFCMKPSAQKLKIGQKLPKEQVAKLKQLTPDQQIASGALVVMKNGTYKVAQFDEECGKGFFKVITKLDPRSGFVVKTEDIFLLEEKKPS